LAVLARDCGWVRAGGATTTAVVSVLRRIDTDTGATIRQLVIGTTESALALNAVIIGGACRFAIAAMTGVRHRIEAAVGIVNLTRDIRVPASASAINTAQRRAPVITFSAIRRGFLQVHAARAANVRILRRAHTLPGGTYLSRRTRRAALSAVRCVTRKVRTDTVAFRLSG